MSEQKSFFATLPGILTGLATLVTAVVGLIYALNEIGFIGSPEKKETPTPVVVPQKPEVVTPQPPVVKEQKDPMEQTTAGWAIIGSYERGKFLDLSLMVHGDSPAIGRHYDAVKDFRLVQKKPKRGQATITLGMVHRGDSVEILDIEVAPGRSKVPVYAKLRAVLHKR